MHEASAEQDIVFEQLQPENGWFYRKRLRNFGWGELKSQANNVRGNILYHSLWI